ncbi:MAG TPA: glycoside hydrolase family 44 protein [Chloroflexota bacterium]
MPRQLRVVVIVGALALAVVMAGLVLARVSGSGIPNAVMRRASVLTARLHGEGSAPPSSVTLTIDPTHVLRPISPLIYGVAHAGPDELVALGASLNRWGGNPNTRYNWEIGYAWNAARDYEFRNYGQDQSSPAQTDSSSDRFVAANREVGVETELTVPAIGWVARNGDKQTRSVGVPDAGGPPRSATSEAIVGYDPTDNRQRTSVPSFARKGAPFADPPDLTDGRVYQDEWIHHLVAQFGLADRGGVRYYAVDNEPDLWSSTHTDVHPVQTSYDDVLATFLDYATAIKSVDPGAKIAGPTLSGWTGYLYSARDRGADNYRTHADRLAHGDTPFLPWWLAQVRAHDQQLGQRSLDVLDVHYYPQASGVFSAADDPQTRGLRLRSTRALWDSSYVDESWIGEPVRLIPRLREWIEQYYPGTQLAIGEWSWGGEQSMSGALAVADVLGIFGREGVDLATYWTFPPLKTPTAQAFAMYTHYDARGDAFGDRAIAASADASADYVTTYASLDSASGDVVVVVINKRADADLPATIHLNGVSVSSAQVYRLDATDATIQDTGTAPVNGSDVNLVLRPMSITLVRVQNRI